MPLAGRMKLNTFLALIGSSIAVCGSATFIGSSILWPDSPEPEPQPQPVAALAAPEAVTSSSSSPPPAETFDAIVLSWQGRALGSEKRKDIESGRPFKINLYQDSGHTTVNRAKVDLDRDDRWDEKWTFDGATVTRQISPGDDEDYSRELTWSGSAWTAPGAAPAPTPEAPEVEAIGRPVDQYLVAQRGRDLGTSKVKDATKGQPYKVNLYQDSGHGAVNRAKVDLDRDDRWDEKWTFDGATITRKVSPGDNEDYSVSQVWGPEGWQ